MKKGMREKLFKFFNDHMHTFSHLFPRSQHVWVFIGWHVGHDMEIFADNSKYLFLHTAHNHPEIKAVWLAKDRRFAVLLRSRGYISYYQHSVLGIWYALRAGTTIIDAYLQPENFRFAGKTRLVQLLHGKGMKKGGYTQTPLCRQDYIFSPSPFVSEMLPATFVQHSPIIISGYPRTDMFFKNIADSDIGVHEPTKMLLENSPYKKRFLYAPTFRRGEKVLDIETILNLSLLSSWLSTREYLLVLSLHPKYRDQARNVSYPNVHFVEDSDVSPILHFFDVLITDYSSIFTDFLLLDKPIIFYPYDLEEYKKKEGLSFDNYDEFTPGPKVYTQETLRGAIEKVCIKDKYSVDRKRVRTLYHAYQDGRSCERVMKSLALEKSGS